MAESSRSTHSAPADGDADGARPTAHLPQTTRPLHGLRPDDPGTVGSYEVLGRVPGHHASDVFIVRSPRQQLCVLKLSGDGGLSDAERIQREADYLRQVRSARVARLIDTGVWQDRVYFVQEFIDGPTLADILPGTGEGLSIPEAYRLARGLAEALRDAHHADVIHRDVKPSNIIIHERKGVVLVDFGIAKTPDEPRITRHGAVGTPGYMSPEQLGWDEVGEPSDIYQWGLVVGEALLGHHPIGQLRADGPAADPALQATRLGRLVLDALQQNPARRPSLPQILGELDRTEVLPRPNETLVIPLPQSDWHTVRTVADARRMARTTLDDLLAQLADRAAVFVAALAGLALLGWLIGFLVGAAVSTPGGAQ